MERTPSQNNQRISKNRADCASFGDSQGRKVSALTGFWVGPKAKELAISFNAPLLRDFSTDGCSSSPDGLPWGDKSDLWIDCCIQHDMAYWIGGSESEKKKADAALSACIEKKGYPEVGRVYETFVRKFGGPDSVKSYRWGYGWTKQRGYQELGPNEEKQIEAYYGANSAGVAQILATKNFPIYLSCDSTDPIFSNLTRDDRTIYRILNDSFKQDHVIEAVTHVTGHRHRIEYNVKLEDCSEALTVVLTRNGAMAQVIKNNCEGLR